MSAVLEQSPEELALLVGAKVTAVRERPENEDGDAAIVVTFELSEPVNDGPVAGRTVDYEVWQDPEGNGPGYLALTAIRP